MSKEEAETIVQEARDKDKWTLNFVTNSKVGTSSERFEKYRSFTTVKEFDDNTKKDSKLWVGALVHDVQMGICEVLDERCKKVVPKAEARATKRGNNEGTRLIIYRDKIKIWQAMHETRKKRAQLLHTLKEMEHRYKQRLNDEKLRPVQFEHPLEVMLPTTNQLKRNRKTSEEEKKASREITEDEKEKSKKIDEQLAQHSLERTRKQHEAMNLLEKIYREQRDKAESNFREEAVSLRSDAERAGSWFAMLVTNDEKSSKPRGEGSAKNNPVSNSSRRLRPKQYRFIQLSCKYQAANRI